MRSRGFTLTEVMISVAILAMIGMLVLGTVSRAMQARDKAQEITERYHEIRQAMQRMGKEISMAFISRNYNCADPRTKTIFAATGSTSGMRLNFTSFSHYKMRVDANESDQNELSYYVDANPDDPKNKALFRREQNRIDDEPDRGGREQILAEGITGLEFNFYDGKEKKWRDEWDTTKLDYRERLPMFVSIKLKALDPSGKEETFVSKTRVFITQRLVAQGVPTIPCVE
jgi:general secretion pathway protein J